MIRAGLILFVLLAAAAPARAHGWYTGLRNRSGISCCEDKDCRPVRLCVLPDRKEGLLIEGVCRPIPWDKVLNVASPRRRRPCLLAVFRPPAGRAVCDPARRDMRHRGTGCGRGASVHGPQLRNSGKEHCAASSWVGARECCRSANHEPQGTELMALPADPSVSV